MSAFAPQLWHIRGKLEDSEPGQVVPRENVRDGYFFVT